MTRHLEETFYDANASATQTASTATKASNTPTAPNNYGGITVSVYFEGRPVEVNCTNNATPRACATLAGVKFNVDQRIYLNGKELNYIECYKPLRDFPQNSRGGYMIAVL